MSRIEDIAREAQAELDAEEHRRLVDSAKDRIRANKGRPWYVRLFPYRIKIERL